VSQWAQRHVEPEIIEGELIEDAPPRPHINYELAAWALAGAITQIIIGSLLCSMAVAGILSPAVLLAFPGFWLIVRGIRQARRTKG
jgi:hypothetical protein